MFFGRWCGYSNLIYVVFAITHKRVCTNEVTHVLVLVRTIGSYIHTYITAYVHTYVHTVLVNCRPCGHGSVWIKTEPYILPRIVRNSTVFPQDRQMTGFFFLLFFLGILKRLNMSGLLSKDELSIHSHFQKVKKLNYYRIFTGKIPKDNFQTDENFSQN